MIVKVYPWFKRQTTGGEDAEEEAKDEDDGSSQVVRSMLATVFGFGVGYLCMIIRATVTLKVIRAHSN
jgi:hypothetical protein